MARRADTAHDLLVACQRARAALLQALEQLEQLDLSDPAQAWAGAGNYYLQLHSDADLSLDLGLEGGVGQLRITTRPALTLVGPHSSSEHQIATQS
jgi:hypothetical protein